MDRYSFSSFATMLNQFASLVKSHSAITTYTGRRMNIIMLMLEAESLLEELGDYYKAWKSAFPLNVQIDALQKLEKQFDPDNNKGLFCRFPESSYDDSSIDQACTYLNEEGNYDEELQKQYIDENNLPKYTQESVKHSMRHSFHYPVRTSSRHNHARRSYRLDSKVFNKLFEYKPADLFSMFDSMNVGFTELGKEKIRDFRQFLIMVDYSDLVDILKLEFIHVHDLLKAIVHVVEEPSDEICESLYSNAETLYEESYPEHSAECERWRRYNSKKKDYINRLRLQKDEIRKQVTELGWDSEWEDLFEYEGTRDVQPDYLAIGTLIHYHLDVMQKDDNKNLMLLIKLINDWLFYTWEEMKMLEPDEIPGAVIIPLEEAEQTALTADLHFEVEKEKEKVKTSTSPQINITVQGNVIGHNENNIDKNFAPMIDNHDGGIITKPETKELTDGTK